MTIKTTPGTLMSKRPVNPGSAVIESLTQINMIFKHFQQIIKKIFFQSALVALI